MTKFTNLSYFVIAADYSQQCKIAFLLKWDVEMIKMIDPSDVLNIFYFQKNKLVNDWND